MSRTDRNPAAGRKQPPVRKRIVKPAVKAKTVTKPQVKPVQVKPTPTTKKDKKAAHAMVLPVEEIEKPVTEEDTANLTKTDTEPVTDIGSANQTVIAIEDPEI